MWNRVSKIYKDEIEDTLAKLPEDDQIFWRGDQWPSRRRATIRAIVRPRHPIDERQYFLLYEGDSEHQAREAMYDWLSYYGVTLVRFDDWWKIVDERAKRILFATR